MRKWDGNIPIRSLEDLGGANSELESPLAKNDPKEPVANDRFGAHHLIMASDRRCRPILQREEPRETVSDVDALERLYEVGEHCIRAGDDLRETLEAILDAAIFLTAADKGLIQLYDADSLVIVAQRGFERPLLDFFARIRKESATTCGAALNRVRRVLVNDVMHSDIFTGQASLDVLLAAEVQAVQSTPLISSAGKVLGMISTHFSRPTSLVERELRFIDLVARQAADYLERKQNERAWKARETLLDRIADSMTAFVTQCSRDLRYVFVNKAYADFIGEPPTSIVGRSIVEVIGESAYATVRPYIDRVLAGERVEYETEVTLAAALGTHYVHNVYIPNVDAEGVVRGWIATIQLITEQRQTERKLRDANRHKDQFIAMLAHELRNPLASILSAAQMLNMESRSTSDSWASETISLQASHMARMLDDLLDTSRITLKKLELRMEYLDIVKIIQSAAESTQAIVEAREHQLVLTLPGTPLYVSADRTRLEQVFANLITNAANCTEPSGHIQVVCRRDGSNVQVSVRDNGIGIDPAALPKLFQLFFQAHPSKGLGIGLWLVRELLELHGGSVEAISEGIGKGSEFRVRLPLSQPPPLSAKSVQDVRPAEDLDKKRRVLVVDDIIEVAESLARLLKVMGHEVCVAYDGAEAVTVASKFKPDVILLDIGMPKLNGYDTCRQIRQQPWGKDILIAAVTGWGRDSDIQQAREAGFDRHLPKPVDRSALAKLLASVGSKVLSH